MIDLTKEEQAFFVGYEYWDETRGMQPIEGGDWYWADEVNEVVTSLQKRIAELEGALEEIAGTCWDADEGGITEIQAIAAEALNSGGIR